MLQQFVQWMSNFMQEISKWAEKSRVKGRWLVQSKQFNQHSEACCWKAASVWKVQCSGHLKQTQPVTFINHLPCWEKGSHKIFATHITAVMSSSFSFFSAFRDEKTVDLVSLNSLGDWESPTFLFSLNERLLRKSRMLPFVSICVRHLFFQ